MKTHLPIPSVCGWAFTLIEVLIAVGLLTVAVVAVLGMLPALSKQGGDAVTQFENERLPALITTEIRRLARQDFDSFATNIPVMQSPLADGWPMAASRSDEQAMALNWQTATGTDRLPSAEQYYFIECWRFSDEPLRYTTEKDFIALHVRVSWPYRLPAASGPVTTESRARSELRFTVSITR